MTLMTVNEKTRKEVLAIGISFPVESEDDICLHQEQSVC